MKIEAGKYYRTRDGRKVGPMKCEFGYCTSQERGTKEWRGDGKYWNGEGSGYDCDLIAEWTDEPAAPKSSPFVTRRELVPGVYGKVRLYAPLNREISVKIDTFMNADELDEAAHLFAQLAEYLRETK